MKHIIFTRIRFDDKELMEKYLKITKDVLIPSLNSQKNKNFEWILLVKQDDVEYLREQLDYPFTPVLSIDEYFEYVKNNQINIQTRHDCDDWMAPTYVANIHDAYNVNIKNHDKFLVQSQPIKVMYHTGAVSKLQPYHATRCSMHLSLCQRDVTNHINERIHAKMHEVASHVVTLNGVNTKWMIHGNNITVIGRKK